MDEIAIIIEKNGQTIKNVVTRYDFEKVYKPAGWRIDDEEVVKELATEAKIKNYVQMRTNRNQGFNDGLFKEGM